MTKNESAIIWFPVVNKYFWALKLTDIKVSKLLISNYLIFVLLIKYGGKSLNLCKDKECLITPDTGTSCLTMPSWAM